MLLCKLCLCLPSLAHFYATYGRITTLSDFGALTVVVFSERELMFMFAICRRPSVCLSVVCLSVVCLSSVTFVHPTQPIEIFANVSAPCNTLVT